MKCEKFKEMCDENRAEEARLIFNKYISSTSLHQVNFYTTNNIIYGANGVIRYDKYLYSIFLLNRHQNDYGSNATF